MQKRGEGTHAQGKGIQNLKFLGCSELLISRIDSAIHAQGRFLLYFWFAKSFQEGEQKGAVGISPAVPFGTGWVNGGISCLLTTRVLVSLAGHPPEAPRSMWLASEELKK